MTERRDLVGGHIADLQAMSDHRLRDVGLVRDPSGWPPGWLGPLAGLAPSWPRLRSWGGSTPAADADGNTAELLRAARATVRRVRFCMAVTVGPDGHAHARVVHARAPDPDWGVAFMTSRTSRKVHEVAATGRLTLAYQLNREGAYVALVGTARIEDDRAAKAARWSRGLDRWFPGGPSDPDVSMVRFTAQRIELWSYCRRVMPKPRGLRAAVLERSPEGWTVLAG